MDTLSPYIAAINRSYHYIWEKDDEDYVSLVIVYIVYYRAGYVRKWALKFDPCKFGDYNEVVEKTKILETSMIKAIPANSVMSECKLPIKYLSQKIRSFNDRRMLYENHSHYCWQMADGSFKAIYQLLAKVETPTNFRILITGGSQTAATKGEAIREARKEAEVSMLMSFAHRWSFGPFMKLVPRSIPRSIPRLRISDINELCSLMGTNKATKDSPKREEKDSFQPIRILKRGENDF